jgi:hypothetical protein
MTCGFSGGQGRGRTADLPIFSRSFEADTPKVSDLIPNMLTGLSLFVIDNDDTLYVQ